MAILIERTEEAFINQKVNFDTKIVNHATKLGLKTEQLKPIKDDTTALIYAVAFASILKTASQNANWYKLHLRNGGAELGDFPIVPLFPEKPVVSVSAGITNRFSEFIHDFVIKSPGYTHEIGLDLGIIAPESKEDIENAQPTFKIELTNSSGQPLLIWRKGGFQGVEIWKSTDGINFTKFDKDFSPDTIDKSPLPVLGKSEIWYYKMIYLIKDEWVGKWSEVRSIAVIGH